MANPAVVTVNAGSSSIKLAAFTVGPTEVSHLLSISVSNIGQPVSLLQTKHTGMAKKVEEVHSPSHGAASGILIEKLAHAIPGDMITGIGHRLVHGGGKFTKPVLLESVTEEDWEFLSRLDPQHTPAAHQLATRFTEHYPSIPQVACFDTAFFDDLPRIAKLMPLPKKFYEMGVRRYGFHGLSYASLRDTFHKEAGDVAANGRAILAHLGSGVSITAMWQGKPIDTTMGFTPVSGIPMSTRSGDLDPSIFGFFHRQNNMTADEFDHMVNFESGLLGVSGISGDMQMLLGMEDKSKDAAEAIELFVHNARKSIGALTTVLGGLDSLIFSGGIGEQSSLLRARICQGLEYMGIEINEAANERHDFLISSEQSKTGVHVIPADEARVIARQAIELIKQNET